MGPTQIRPWSQCEGHNRPTALICVHLRGKQRLRYYAIPACVHGQAQAWCQACDDFVRSEHGWTNLSEAQADFLLFCKECYSITLQRHTFVHYVVGPDEPCDFSHAPPPSQQ